MSKRGRGGSAGAKFRISLGLPVGAVINCADNTGKCKEPLCDRCAGCEGSSKQTTCCWFR
uniref:60S ribosomal protein L23 n=1 Tax=Timema tahoe TaxID=61484 RepID=A0A7R9IRN5_9NEOP|nr:unnamed protein product [Timema tahoe]